ncbi:MAG: hypothetical protein WBS19_10440 [Candidatus Korobacteraceae bacterium]
MKRNLGFCLVLALLTAGAANMVAQDYSMAPPKVLVTQLEMLKPGVSGAPHMKTESAFVQAMTAAKWPTRYLGMDSMSGASRALFLVGYDSFAAWEKDTLATQKNTTLSAALDRASIADGQLLTSYMSGVFVYREDLSLRPNTTNVPQSRYFEIMRFKIRPGHDQDWEELVKMYIDGYNKASQTQHWVVFQSMYGTDNGGVYIVFNSMKSLAEVDGGMADSKKFADQMGADGMKKISELTAACVQDVQVNLFAFNPKESYVADAWVKADPTFWKPAAPAPKAAAKPEAKPAQ